MTIYGDHPGNLMGALPALGLGSYRRARIPEAVDEYDSYAPAVIRMLEAGAFERHTAYHLTGVVRDRMGLRPNSKADEDVAAMLRALYAIEA